MESRLPLQKQVRHTCCQRAIHETWLLVSLCCFLHSWPKSVGAWQEHQKGGPRLDIWAWHAAETGGQIYGAGGTLTARVGEGLREACPQLAGMCWSSLPGLLQARKPASWVVLHTQAQQLLVRYGSRALVHLCCYQLGRCHVAGLWLDSWIAKHTSIMRTENISKMEAAIQLYGSLHV